MQEDAVSKVKPNVIKCDDGYHWDFNLHECVPNCPTGYVYCPEIGDCVPSNTECGDGTVPTPLIYLQNFFSTYDTNILKSTDSSQVIAYVTSKNQELINILSTNFPQTYNSNVLNQSDEMVTWAGLIHMLAEGQGKFSAPQNMQAKFAIDWGCVGDVLLGVFDITSLVEDYVHLIKTGGSWSTIRGLLWRTLKRQAGWFVAAKAVYDIVTDCF
ncbi:MAG TPA: hypothetical protein VHD35_01880 [Chitinophagaceae bacterium]|jgi:hypothetical protein|nr:hypothetical protein [Chitinophagaceae bacterium]